VVGVWEDLDGPDNRVGVDYWYRNRTTGAEVYANLDQDYLTISVGVFYYRVDESDYGSGGLLAFAQRGEQIC